MWALGIFPFGETKPCTSQLPDFPRVAGGRGRPPRVRPSPRPLSRGAALPADDNTRGSRPQAEQLCAMAASPGGTPAPAVETLPPQPAAHTPEPGSVSANRGARGEPGVGNRAERGRWGLALGSCTGACPRDLRVSDRSRLTSQGQHCGRGGCPPPSLRLLNCP